MSAIVRPKSSSVRRASRLFVELAATDTAVRESQVLRYRVFAEELGARLPQADAGLDCDPYDPHCHHLLVRELDSGSVIASTRLLSADRARSAGGFYSENKFDLGHIRCLAKQGARRRGWSAGGMHAAAA
jgi:putative hemolysin